MRLLAIIQDTFREGIARKTIIAFFVISSIAIIIAILVAVLAKSGSLVKVNEALPPEEQAMAAKTAVTGIQFLLASFVETFVIFLGVFATASIIPNMMEKGTVDLLLSKPVSRMELLFGKLIGSLLIVFFNIAYFIVAMWIITSLKAGYWNTGFLLSMLSITFSFFVLYSIMMWIGVMSRSTALSIIIVLLFVLIIGPILGNREQIANALNNQSIADVLSVFYYILPKTQDISKLTLNLITNQSFSWMPIWSSGAFAAAMIGLSVWLFGKKEF